MTARSPEIEFLCPECEAPIVVAWPDEKDWTCEACGNSEAIHAPAPAANAPVSRCAACGCPKLYVQKDFNRNAGLLVVAFTAIVSGVVLMLTHSTIWAMLVLGVVTVADALIYRMLPTVTVCYRCEAVHRRFPRNPVHEAFDIHTAEEFAYGQE